MVKWFCTDTKHSASYYEDLTFSLLATIADIFATTEEQDQLMNCFTAVDNYGYVE